MKKILFAFISVSLLAFSACKKDETPDPDPTPVPLPAPVPAASLKISFANVVDADPLILGGPYHWVNAHGDSFSVNMYKYYVSNIKLTDNNGNTWVEPESYHLINQSNSASLTVQLYDVPDGVYTSMEYMIGVDSARNTSGAQTGALDPALGMIWTWNTGYVMAKLEGKSNVSTASAHNITFHVAGFGGATASQRIVSPSFGAFTANVSDSIVPVIHINSNVQEWFRNPSTVRFDITNNVTTTGADALMIADNYVDMFTVTGIDN